MAVRFFLKAISHPKTPSDRRRRWGGVSGGYAASAIAPPAKIIAVKPAKIIVAVYDIVKETLDIEFHNPVVLPASPPYQGNRVMGRAPRSIAIGVWMEHRVDLRLQQELDHRLRHPVSNRRHAQHTHTT